VSTVHQRRVVSSEGRHPRRLTNLGEGTLLMAAHGLWIKELSEAERSRETSVSHRSDA
jgi:hypothetical protein